MKLTDHLLAILQHVDHYAQEAGTIAPLGLGVLGLVTGLIHATVAMLEHSPLTITLPVAPIAPPR